MNGDNFFVQEEKMGTMSRIARAPLTQRALPAGRRPINSRWGGFVSLAGGMVVALTDLLYLWQQRLRDREALLQMTTAQLKDIGLSRADALQEAEKPFWRR
jgi:uncharacterized protein YjiS (DUF1127 family)